MSQLTSISNKIESYDLFLQTGVVEDSIEGEEACSLPQSGLFIELKICRVRCHDSQRSVDFLLSHPDLLHIGENIDHVRLEVVPQQAVFTFCEINFGGFLFFSWESTKRVLI